MDDSTSGLSKKLDHLFRTVRRPDGGEYSFEEVADGIRSKGGATITGVYVWQLRSGKRTNPTKTTLEALADFFGVSPAYFFDDDAAKRVDAQLELLSAMRDAHVSQIALRAFGLSENTLRSIAGIIENARQIEGLPGAESPPPGRRPRSQAKG